MDDDRFPWLSHRTMAEVRETEDLARIVVGSIINTPELAAASKRLTQLLAKAPTAEIYPLAPRVMRRDDPA